MERALVVAAVLALSGCVTETVVVPEPKVKTYSPHDPAAIATLKCDALVVRGSDAHRLCMMREIDRLKTWTVPQAAPIQILPFPYPPLAPSGSTVFLR